MLKTFSLIIAVLYSVALTVVSLINLNDMPDIGVSFGDKIFHCFAYLILTFLWVNAMVMQFYLKKIKAIIYASMFSVVFGIVIEVLQGSVTLVRAADFNDVIANTIGVVIAVIVLLFNKGMYVKKI